MRTGIMKTIFRSPEDVFINGVTLVAKENYVHVGITVE